MSPLQIPPLCVHSIRPSTIDRDRPYRPSSGSATGCISPAPHWNWNRNRSGRRELCTLSSVHHLVFRLFCSFKHSDVSPLSACVSCSRQWRIQRYWLERANWGDTKGVGSPQNFLILKVKMAHFCALLSIDLKVCRLITETVSDHIRKTNRLCFLPFFRASEARTRK